MTQTGQTRWLGSLRSRILLLALLVCVLLGSAVTGFALLLQQTRSTILAASSSHLSNVLAAFAKDFLSAAGNSPEVTAWLNEQPGPATDDALRPYTIGAFRRDPGIEGGFYSANTGSLLGYAFPTNDGPGPKQDIPPRERPTILSVAQQAAMTDKPALFSFHGEKDVILFQAVPLMRGGHVLGSVWGMRRIHDAEAGRDLQALLGLSTLALAAMACVGVAFWITRNVQADVAAIQARLQDMERDLNEPSRGEVSATELNVIMSGINRLGISLREKIAQERQLVEKLHHKERLASLGQVAAGVAHELRNPLATIRLRTQMSLRSKDSEQIDRSAKLILEEIDRLSGVLDRLLYFAKPIKLQVTRIDPVSLCRDVLDALQPEAERVPVELSLEDNCEPGEAQVIYADSLKLRQVLENLVRNAVESFDGKSEDAGKVTIFVTANRNTVTVAVIDNGAGLAPDAETKSFEPFFTTKARGTGLGLSIASEIVRAHGGSLQLRRAQTRGTIAELVLPRELAGNRPERGA